MTSGGLKMFIWLTYLLQRNTPTQRTADGLPGIK